MQKHINFALYVGLFTFSSIISTLFFSQKADANWFNKYFFPLVCEPTADIAIDGATLGDDYTFCKKVSDTQNSFVRHLLAQNSEEIDFFNQVIPNSLNISTEKYDFAYFDNGATIFYGNGISYCGFVSPTHLNFFRRVNVAQNLGRQNPRRFGKYTGACPIPTGYFENGGTVYFSAGNGSFCGFPNSEAFYSHRRTRPQAVSWGRIDVAPSRFLTYEGVCQ